MYDEFLKRLWECASGECFNCSQYTETTNASVCQKELLKEAADAIEELSEDNAALNGTIANLLEQIKDLGKPRWVSVEERLPEQRINQNTLDFEYVLCATTFGDVRPYKYGRRIGQGDAHFWSGAGYIDAYITHWMPLPEPPKEET